MLARIIFLTLFLGAAFTQAAFASVSLSVNPVDGSNTLRFARTSVAGMENKQEIHIRVSSPNGDRYQVFQRILEPIVNEKGDALNLQAVQTQTLTNSNSSGTLYLQNSGQLNMSDQLLYSSSQSGQSDMFIIGYSLNQNLINTAGNFRGRLIFTVRGIGNASSDQVTIDMFLDSTSSMKVSVKGAHDPNRLRIQATDTTEKSADFINFSFSGNSGQEIRIYQETKNYPQNETGQELGGNILQLDAEGATEGLRAQGLSSLGNGGRTLIYSSDKDEDSFVIYFLVDAAQVQQQDAGVYTGRLNYMVETGQGKQEFPIDIQCTVPPVFSMNITPPAGGVSFTHVLA